MPRFIKRSRWESGRGGSLATADPTLERFRGRIATERPRRNPYIEAYGSGFSHFVLLFFRAELRIFGSFRVITGEQREPGGARREVAGVAGEHIQEAGRGGA